MTAFRPDSVVVHPLVLLSVVDHYNRVAKDTRKRVVGVILGESHKGTLEATNSFAVPFEEDDRDPSIWFLDHNYLENMFLMFKKVNARERVIGWYHTGPRLRESDLDIHGLLGNYCSNPLLLICEVQPKEVGLPVHAYVAEDEVSKDGTQRATKVFVNLPTVVGSTEAEQIGVEHLLRDVKDATVGTLSSEIGDVVHGLRGLKSRLLEIQDYLGKVVDGTLPLNHDILRNLQDIFTLLPDLDVEGLATSFSCEVNDWMAVTYLASLLRAIIALHTLVENKEARLAKETHRAKVEGAKEAEEAKADKAEASSVLKNDGGASDGTSD